MRHPKGRVRTRCSSASWLPESRRPRRPQCSRRT